MNQKGFHEIEILRGESVSLIEEVRDKCFKLDVMYKEYVKQVTKDSIISLDTLFFQVSMIKKDIDNLQELFDLSIYQMYGQYYKFYRKVLNYAKNLENEVAEEIFKGLDYDQQFEPYYDLQFKMYSFEEIKCIHNLITSIILRLTNFTSKRGREIEDYEDKINQGINIDAMVFEKKRCNDNMINEIRMFMNILDKFYDSQRKNMNRVILKLRLLYFQIASEIQFDGIKTLDEDEHVLYTCQEEKSSQEYVSVLFGLFLKIKMFFINFFSFLQVHRS